MNSVSSGPKLALGTVQFGLNYGLTNQNGQTEPAEAARILSLAQEEGIDLLDTASGYGNSEEVLGRIITQEMKFKIVTKIPSLSPSKINAAEVAGLKEAFSASLRRLTKRKVYGLLMHDADDLLSKNGDALFEALQEISQRSETEKIGVSVYTAAQIDAVVDKYPISLIQLPINILDQRLLNSGHLDKLKAKGIEVHARSIFLQGLLLEQPDKLKPYFKTVKPLLMQYRQDLARVGLSPLEGAFSFARSLKQVSRLVIGVCTSIQLKENLRAFNAVGDKNSAAFALDFSKYSFSDEKILNPSHWPAYEKC